MCGQTLRLLQACVATTVIALASGCSGIATPEQVGQKYPPEDDAADSGNSEPADCVPGVDERVASGEVDESSSDPLAPDVAEGEWLDVNNRVPDGVRSPDYPDSAECPEGACRCAFDCQDDACGENGCGGSCGDCAEYFSCVSGTCLFQPWCGDTVCESSAAETCATCPEDCPCGCGKTCSDGECVFFACDDKKCGDDGCGGTCGECLGFQESCSDGQCLCMPDCGANKCGPDGCGGECEVCGGQQEKCTDGQCVCVPDCQDKACGEDGCGGGCGECAEHFACVSGSCLFQPWCGDTLCESAVAETCAICPGDCPCGCGETCSDGECVFLACDDKKCGDDGCGGSCGECAEHFACEAGVCLFLPWCGDGECGESELCGNCPADCGECIPDGLYPQGMVIITELMPYSSYQRWWIEILNTTGFPVDLSGWSLTGPKTGTHIIVDCAPATVAPGELFTIGSNPPKWFGAAMVFDYEYEGGWGTNGFKLRQDTEVSLVAPDGIVVDTVAYGGIGFPKIPGRAVSLTSDVFAADLNDLPQNWCTAVTKLDENDYGTPGTPNPPCYTPGACGNGKVEPGEECDGGNDKDGDGCDHACQLETGLCGNAMVEPAGAEQCDDGNKLGCDGCSEYCYLEACGFPSPTCGDGKVQTGEGEQCDDGNHANLDGCDWMCLLEPVLCGNGFLNPGELCDDGNKTDFDGCSSACKWQCGDGEDSDQEGANAPGPQAARSSSSSRPLVLA